MQQFSLMYAVVKLSSSLIPTSILPLLLLIPPFSLPNNKTLQNCSHQ